MFFFIGILLSNGQEIENEIYQQKKLDSINQTPKKPLLLSEVKYTAKDCVRINRKENKLWHVATWLHLHMS